MRQIAAALLLLTSATSLGATQSSPVSGLSGGGGSGDGALLDGATPTRKATVKAGSTAPAATDTALVVQPRDVFAVAQSGAPWSVSGSGTFAARLTDATNNLSKLIDLDTSGTTHEYTLGVSLRLSGSGGSVSAGTASNPLRFDPVGTTPQPVTLATAPLPANAAQDSTLTGGTAREKITDGTNNAALANSAPAGTEYGLITRNIPSGVQPVSFSGQSVTANVGTTGGLALNSAQTDGTQKSIARGGAKGSTAAADVTSTATDANHQALDVNLNNIPHVVVDTAPSTAVTNAGTFAVQAAQSGSWGVGLNAGSNLVGKFGIDQTTPGTTNLVSIGSNGTVGLLAGSAKVGQVAIDQATPGTTNLVSIGTNGTVGITSAAATAKNTQGANGVPTQDLHDAGRNMTNLFMVTPILTTATDALMSLTGYKAGAAVTATTTPAVVTSGKTYRITKAIITYVAIATAGTAKFTLRANTGGVVAIGSPAVSTWIIGGPAATAGVSYTVDISIPEGMEFAAGTGIGVSLVGLGSTQVAAAVGYAQIALHGYEY